MPTEVAMTRMLLALLFICFGFVTNASPLYGATGTLMVSGQPGSGQPATFSYVFCQIDAAGKMLKGGCNDEFQQGLLNTPVEMPAGNYMVSYNHTGTEQDLIAVKPGQQTAIQLAMIRLAPLQGRMTANIFVDYRDDNEQRKYFVALWGYEDRPSSLSSRVRHALCSLNTNIYDSLFRIYCDATNAVNYNDPAYRAQIQFDSGAQGSLIQVMVSVDNQTSFDSSHWSHPMRSYLLDVPNTGEAYAVFPGVYGIAFYNGGNPYSDSYGIIAK
jgi:hypothetical protein